VGVNGGLQNVSSVLCVICCTAWCRFAGCGCVMSLARWQQSITLTLAMRPKCHVRHYDSYQITAGITSRLPYLVTSVLSHLSTQVSLT